MVVIFSGHYMSKEANQEKFYAMLASMVGVMIVWVCAHDLFNLWIWFEAMAITSYPAGLPSTASCLCRLKQVLNTCSRVLQIRFGAFRN